jgi:hypothetical protein
MAPTCIKKVPVLGVCLYATCRLCFCTHRGRMVWLQAVRVQDGTDRRRMKRKNILQNLGYDTHPLVTDANATGGVQIQILCHEGAPRLSLFYTCVRATPKQALPFFRP